MDNLRRGLGMRGVNKMWNEDMRKLCDMKKRVNERINWNISR